MSRLKEETPAFAIGRERGVLESHGELADARVQANYREQLLEILSTDA